MVETDLARLKALLDVFEGREPVGNRLKPILNPDKIQTSTILTQNQVHFVADSYWLKSMFPEFSPLQAYAEEFANTQLSHEGKGVENAIRFTGAIAEGKLVKSLVLGGKKEEEPKKRFWKRDKKEREEEGTE